MASFSSEQSDNTPHESANIPPMQPGFGPVEDWDELCLPPDGVWEHVHEKGRRYHLYQYGRYPIPNDDEEQRREDMKHAMMLEITNGRHYYAPIGDDPKKILDIGTGTGIWAVEMGDLFPGAQVLGTDLSPIQPEWLPENVRFIIDDLEAEWMNGGDWDFVHLRHMAAFILEPDHLVQSIFDNTKPGGWIEFQELYGFPYCDDETMKPDDPVIAFYDMLSEALELRGMNHNKIRQLRGPLRRAGFTNIELIKKKVPLGPWARDRNMRLIGHYLKKAVLDLVPALMKRPMDALGLTDLQREVWIAKIRRSLADNSVHRYFYFYFWYAQKPAA